MCPPYPLRTPENPDPLDEGHTPREGPSMLPSAFDLAGRVALLVAEARA
jgi:hypothetical protein